MQPLHDRKYFPRSIRIRRTCDGSLLKDRHRRTWPCKIPRLLALLPSSPPFNWKTCRILGRPMCVHHVMARGYDFLSPSSFDGYRCFTFFFFYGFRHIFAHDTSHLLSRNWTIESFCDLHFFLSFNYFSCASYGFFPFSFYLYISSSWMTNDRSLISKNISSVIREYIYIYSE